MCFYVKIPHGIPPQSFPCILGRSTNPLEKNPVDPTPEPGIKLTMINPQDSYISWFITPITMVYGIYNELVTGAFAKPTNISWGPHIVVG